MRKTITIAGMVLAMAACAELRTVQLGDEVFASGTPMNGGRIMLLTRK